MTRRRRLFRTDPFSPELAFQPDISDRTPGAHRSCAALQRAADASAPGLITSPAVNRPSRGTAWRRDTRDTRQ